MIDPGIHVRAEIPTRESVVAELERLKKSSARSYRSLAREVGLSFSTVCDWIKLTHLPFPRQRDHFVALVRAMGAQDPEHIYSMVQGLREAVRDRPRNPYRGLRPFTEGESRLFFGREALTDRLVHQTLEGLERGRAHPVMVIGASGSGKSSILRAGLMAELIADHPGLGVDYMTLAELGVDETVARLSGFRGPGVVIVDQFEEWLSGARAPDAARLMTAFAELSNASDVQVVVGIRSDYFARASTHELLLAGLQDTPTVIGPMTSEEVTRAIVRPATRVSLTVEPELVAQLLAEFGEPSGSGSVSLPLLSHVLYVLVESSDRRMIGIDHYRELGGMRTALENTAEEAFTATHCGEAACRLLFTQLVELGPDGQATRRVCRIDDLHRHGAGADLETLVAEFASGRLLTLDRDTVTISHEALLTSWPRLATWIEQERDRLEAMNRLQAACLTWRRTGEDPAGLLRGSLLATAGELESLPHMAVRLTADDREFISASRRAEQRRAEAAAAARSRDLAMRSDLWTRIDPNTSARLAILAHETAATVEARSALIGMTASLPGARYLGGPGPTVLAVAGGSGTIAYSNPVTGQVRVLETFADHESSTHLGPFGSDVTSLALSHDGRMLAVGRLDGTVEVWDPTVARRLDSFVPIVSSPVDCLGTGAGGPPSGSNGPGRDAVTALRFSRGGDLLWSAVRQFGCVCSPIDGDGTVAEPLGFVPVRSVLDLALDEERGLIAVSTADGAVSLGRTGGAAEQIWCHRTDGSGPAPAVAISPDGRLLAAGFHDGRVGLWALRTTSGSGTGGIGGIGVDRLELDRHKFGTWVNSVDFDPTSRLLAAASSDGMLRVWGIDTLAPATGDRRHPTVVTAVRFRDPTTVVTTAEDGTARTWDVGDALIGHSEDSAWSLDIDRSGRFAITASRNEARIAEVGTDSSPVDFRRILPHPGHDFSGAAALSPGGDWYAIGTRTGPIRVGPVDGDGDQLFTGLDALVEHLAFSSDGSLLGAAGRDGRVGLWRLGLGLGDGGTEFESFEVCPPALALAFDSGGGLLAVTSESGDTTLAGLDGLDSTGGPEVLSTFRPGDSFALGVAFHPDRPVLAVGNADRSVSLWDCAQPRQPRILSRLRGPAGSTFAVEFSPDGRRLAVGTTDGVLWIWDVSSLRSPRLVARIRSPEQGVYAVAFWPLADRISGVGPRHRCFTWTLDEDRAVKMIRAAVGDELTADESEVLGLASDSEDPL